MSVRLPKVRLRSIPVFPASVSGGTGIEITKANGIFTISLDVSDLNISAVAEDATATTYAVAFGGVTDDNPGGSYSLVPFAGFQANSADLTSLAELGTTGLVARIGDADYATRTITAGTGIGVTNGGGIAGNPTVAITDVELLALAGLTSAADRLFYFTGSGTAALATFTAFGRSLVDDADAATARATLGLTSPATATPAALTKVDDTNVTLALGGTPATALLQATSITVGWTGTLAAARLNSNVVQAITNDTNVTGSISAQNLTLAWSGQLAVGRGGTGIASYAIGDLLYASGATTLSKLADVATGNALISGGLTAAPAWGKIGLTTHVSGVLPVANGGTNASSASGTALDNITGFASTGILVRTASGTYAFRTLTAPAAGITVTNGDGVSGNQTLVLANDLSALEGLSGTGLARRTGTDAWSVGTTAAINEGGTGQITATAAFDALSPNTTRGDLAIRGASSNVRLAVGAANRVLRSDGTDPSWAQVSLSTDVTGTLQAAQEPAHTGDVTNSAGSLALAIGATKVTSAMLNADVFSTAHSWAGQQTFTAPILGTPASGVATNLTGTAAGLTAGNVTTNANSTGDVTSVGNATTFTGKTGGALGQIPGTATNDDASAGRVGEYVSSAIVSGSAVSIAVSATPINVTSISLSAGDWDVKGTVHFQFDTTTSVTRMITVLNTTSATFNGAPGFFTDFGGIGAQTYGGSFINPTFVTTTRYSLSATTTIYLIANAVFTVSFAKAYGLLQARRVR